MSSKRYSLEVGGNASGTYKRFTIVPRHYKRSCAFNLLFYVVANAGIFGLVERASSWSQLNKRVAETFVALLMLGLIRNPKIESLSVFRSLGIQTSEMRGCVLLPVSVNSKLLEQRKFIPKDRVGDIIINEGFEKGFKVIFYLAIILKDASRIQLVFPVCLRFLTLKLMWR
ncbi:LAQU0S13e01464g1_1 [Lachancea quebecensis]|uniref:LAQU0S13e01464g1_1 n=1 Tax=Lachancea quebecensis TaxID=1654605 RepID=A0A0P1KVB4_9SACH|nr:LAQU0S13e01464g1_1 [Lachancea quebecensis]